MALPTLSAQTPLRTPTVPAEIQSVLETEGAFLRADQAVKLARTFTSVSCWPSVAKEMLKRRLATLIPPHVGTISTE
eukprot:1364867-Amphidinium_carterae.3